MRPTCCILLALTCLLSACRPTPQPSAHVPASPPTIVAPLPAPIERALWKQAKQTFDQRCVVCHGCYDSPCQLVLSSFDGIARGATKQEVYDGARLFAVDPTRLHVDAKDVAGWREKAFFSVLPEGVKEEPRASLLLRMLELKKSQPLPVGGPLPEGFDLGIDRAQVCPKAEEFEDFAEDHPLWGMPYALPGLSAEEHDQLVAWVREGTPHEPEAAPAPALGAAIERWEAFFNRKDNKGRLVARYIYEHLFLASLYFEERAGRARGPDERLFFRVVRSRTPPGEPIDEIPTRRPFEDPGKEPFFYRLRPRERTVLAKTNMPYLLSEARLARYEQLFFEPEYQVANLPSYELEVAANPFATFRALPVRSRYRFMLEEAQFTLNGFIKGPVCRGQVALDVIEDRFWVTFVDPESPIIAREADWLAEQLPNLRMPAEQGSNGLLVTWRRYARSEKRFLESKSKFLGSLAKNTKITLEQLWDGDGKNANAALTVMRHYDSATVLHGLVGGDPKTAWVLGFAVLERIHYLLVAGFDVFGNVGHQLHTRLYMDFLRMEAEHNFLLLLPKARRRPLVEGWYRETSDEVKDRVYGEVARLEQETGISYRTSEPEHELYELITERLKPVLELKYGVGEERVASRREKLGELALLGGKAASFMPELSFLELRAADGERSYFTLLRDSAHTNVAHVFSEEKRRRPDEDQLTLLRGFVGAYPNALFSLAESELDEFIADVRALDSREGYEQLRARFGIRRTDAHFWEFSDRIHAAYRKSEPIEAGLFDFNRLDGE